MAKQTNKVVEKGYIQLYFMANKHTLSAAVTRSDKIVVIEAMNTRDRLKQISAWMEAIQKETIFISLNKEMTLDSTKWKKRIHAIELRNLVRWYSREILFFFYFYFFWFPHIWYNALRLLLLSSYVSFPDYPHHFQLLMSTYMMMC